MGLGSGEWSQWVAGSALCAPASQPASQPTNATQRWACVPQPSLRQFESWLSLKGLLHDHRNTLTQSSNGT